MARTFKVSQSKVKTYQMCRLAYYYKYVEKLAKNTKSRPLKFGTIVHNMLEAKANREDPFALLEQIKLEDRKLFLEEREAYGDIIQDIKFIMTDYFKFWKKDKLITIRRKGIAAEHKFSLLVGDGLVLEGKIDQVVKSEDGLRWLEEHKTFGKAIPQADHLWRNLQSSIYLRVLDLLGWKPLDGVLWNFIHSKPPGRISINKDGEVSKRRLSTLPSALKASLKAAGKDWREHRVMMSNAKLNRSKYYQRIYNPVNHRVVGRIFKDLVDTAYEMSENHGKSRCQTFGRHCEWCDYEQLCRAELTGADVDYLKERNYHERKKEEIPPSKKSKRTKS